MKNVKTKIGLILLMAFLVHISGFAYAQSEIMPIGDIQVGMRGIGKTVISGAGIEEFSVEILGILHGQSLVGDLILVRVSGPLIEKTGGIASGMSGSPVYVDDKLIGAIGYGWGLTDHRMGLVTPIESMLRVLAKDASDPSERIYMDFEHEPGLSHRIQAQHRALESIDLVLENVVQDERISRIDFFGSYEEAVAYASVENGLVAYPASTPLMVSGLSGRALERLMNDLKQYDLIPVQTGGSVSGASSGQHLEPGSAIAAQLVRGDIDVSAIGTLTYLEDNQFLAFGHPFLKLGDVEFLLTDAEILAVVDSLEMPFKLGVAGKPRGVVTQDRNTAIAGYLERSPRIIPVSVTVQDLDLHEKQEIAFQVIRDEELMVSLVINAVLQAVDTVMDRQGYGTSLVSFQIVGDKLPDQMISYHNMYYSSDDIAAGSLGDLFNILDIIAINPFDKVGIGSIQVEVKVLRNRQFAIIEEIKLLNDTLYPGDTAQVEVAFRPYRGELVKKVYEVKIPETVQPGEATLTVSGGPYGSYSEEEYTDTESEDIDEMAAVADHIKSLEAQLNEYLKQPLNNELLLEITPYSAVTEESGVDEDESGDANDPAAEKGPVKVSVQQGSTRNSENATDDTDTEEESPLMRETFPTQYVLEGSLSFELTIAEPVEDTTVDEENTDNMGNVVKGNK